MVPRSSLTSSIPVEVLEEPTTPSAPTLSSAQEDNKTKEKSSERRDSQHIDDKETKTQEGKESPSRQAFHSTISLETLLRGATTGGLCEYEAQIGPPVIHDV